MAKHKKDNIKLIKNILFIVALIAIVFIITRFSTQNKCVNSTTDLNQQLISNTINDKNCPELDCSTCPVKTETKIKTITNTITKEVYVCSDGKQVNSSKLCVNNINYDWNISSNKSELIDKLNSIKDPLGWDVAVDITKLTISSDNVINISYTEKDTAYQVETVGQTMFTILKTTANYLKLHNKLDYDVKINAITSNGGCMFSKNTTKKDIISILNYNIGMNDWINNITELNCN